MGEANELSQEQGSNITYRAFKGVDGTLKCRVFELDKFIKEMSLDELVKEYNTILMRYNKSQNTNFWDRLNQPKNKVLRLEIADKHKEFKPDQKMINKDER